MQTLLLSILFVCLLVDIGLVLFTLTRPDRKRTSSFSALCLVLLIYTLGYMAEVFAVSPESAFVALVVENFSIPLIAPLYMLTSFSLFVPSRYRNSYLIWAMAYGLIFFTIVLTNEFHQMYYTSIEIASTNSYYYLQLGRGPLFFLNQGIAIVCMFTSYSIMLNRFFRGSKKLRRQMAFFIVGSVVTFIANVLNFSGLLPAGLDPTPIAMTLSLVLFSISFLTDDLMDVVVRARNMGLETMENAFVVLDTDADFLYCNQSAARLFPDLQHFEGTEPITDVENWPEELTNLAGAQHSVFTLTQNGKERNYRANIREINSWNAKQIGLSVIIQDITEETRLIHQLEALATTDSLTGILNRRRFFEMIDRELEAARRFGRTTALIMFDLDHFKRINDAYGHNIGDEVLKGAVSAISAQLRVYDVFGRVGGEEFLIFTQSPGQNGLMSFAERLRSTLEKLQVNCDDNSVQFTASFGITEILPGEDINLAFKRADAAMYRAKREGRNRVAFDDQNGSIPENSND